MKLTKHEFQQRRNDTLTRANVAHAAALAGSEPDAVVRWVTGRGPDAFGAKKWARLVARAGRLLESRAAQKGA
jgi:hypothetical protein